jgi:hypothetical protein
MSDYPVGYKKPPRHTQFKPGQSGNRSGRPKQHATFADVLTKQLRKSVTVTIGNTVQKIPLLEAVAMKHISKAASGDPKSTAIVLAFLKPNENDRSNNLSELLQQFRSIHACRKVGKRVPTGSIEASLKKKD